MTDMVMASYQIERTSEKKPAAMPAFYFCDIALKNYGTICIANEKEGEKHEKSHNNRIRQCWYR